MNSTQPKMIQSVQRALDILNIVAKADSPVSLAEISRTADLHINTARGLVQTLQVNNYLARSPADGCYYLGYEFLTKSDRLYTLRVKQIRETAYGPMQKISNAYHIQTFLQLCFDADVFTVTTAEPTGSFFSYRPKTGAVLPIYASASGKLQLAYMPRKMRDNLLDTILMVPYTENTITDREHLKKVLAEVRRQRFGFENEELEIGVSSLAVPFFDEDGQLAGTLSAVGAAGVIRDWAAALRKELEGVSDRVTDTIFAARFSR